MRPTIRMRLLSIIWKVARFPSGPVMKFASAFTPHRLMFRCSIEALSSCPMSEVES